MNQPLLSVIVPCYNVEKYIDKCISSIVGQTYSNLEILLIDDGSPDDTGMICDAWQKKDQRIQVIHKQNEGASYARKTGVKNAAAEFVTFVDSDDWIDHNMYTDMMTALFSTNSDIAECDLCYVYEDGQVWHRNECNTAIKTVGRIEGVCGILKDHCRMSFNTKIFKKYLFDDIEFPKVGYGDDLIVYQLYHHALQTVYLDSEYYFYLQRSNSMCNTKNNIPAELKKLRDWSDVFDECYVFLKRHPEYHDAFGFVRYCTMCVGIRLLHSIIAYPQQFTGEYFSMKAKLLRSIPFVKGDRVPRNAKIEVYLLKMNLGLYKVFRMFYNRVIRYTNRLKITDKRTCIFINEPYFYW